MSKMCCLLFACCFYTSVCFAQNIGIGTKTPAEKLHVAGNIKSDTVKADVLKLAPNAGEGKILTSDANGNASWKTSEAAMSRTTDVPGNVGFGVWGDCATNGAISEYNPVTDSTLKPSANFGKGVSISGNFAIVGARSNGVGATTYQGTAHIFQYSGNEWVNKVRLVDNTGGNGDNFGISVAISGKYAAVGAPGTDVNGIFDQGAVSIYQFDGTNWIFTQRITDPSGVLADRFGASVAISDSYLVIGADSDDHGIQNQGTVSVYRLIGSTWVFMQKLWDNTAGIGDGFGNSVSISGNDIIVGASLDDVGSNVDQGSVTFYRYNGSAWTYVQKMVSTSGSANDAFGTAVSISGNYAIVGAPKDDDINGIPDVGSVTVFRYNGFSWVAGQTMEPLVHNEPAWFGNNVCIAGNYILIGAPNNNHIPGTWVRGAVFIYQKLEHTWQRLQVVTDPAGEDADNLGSGVAIDAVSRRFLIGAIGYSDCGKAVFGKIN